MIELGWSMVFILEYMILEKCFFYNLKFFKGWIVYVNMILYICIISSL